MKALYYHLHLLEPALVTALEGDPNSAVAFDYIPGSVMRGMIIGLYTRQNGIRELDASDGATRRVFFSDDVQYLNAYPVVSGKRTLPVPKSWHVKKGESAPIYDFAWETNHPENPKGVSGFALTADVVVTKALEERFIAVHTQRDRHKGRSVQGSGAIYRYDALAAGQTFAGAILCEHDNDAEWLLQFIYDGIETQVGGARSAGYGRIKLEQVAVIDNWTEHVSHFNVEQPLVITLLSDAILRNPSGEYEPNLPTLCSVLAHRLNIAPQTLGVASQNQIYMETTLVGGFNRKWGLPLPQTAALKMGSTVVFTDHSLTQKNVDYLMRWGIGERRTEGFGRIGVNIYNLPEYQVSELDKPNTNLNEQQHIATYRQLSTSLAYRKLLRILDNQITQQANKISLSIKNPPRSSQINALRSVVENVLRVSPINTQTLTDALNYLDKRGATRRQFDKARINGQKLTEWIGRIISDEDDWNTLKSNANISSLITASKRDEITMRKQYNLRLIDAVLARAAKQAQRKENSDA
jgi:CRISPR-associated protein Csx10